MKRQLDAIYAVTLDLQAQVKHSRVSETTFDSAGQVLLASCEQTSATHIVLPTTDPTRPENVRRLLPSNLQEQWDAAASEKDLQVHHCHPCLVLWLAVVDVRRCEAHVMLPIGYSVVGDTRVARHLKHCETCMTQQY